MRNNISIYSDKEQEAQRDDRLIKRFLKSIDDKKIVDKQKKTILENIKNATLKRLKDDNLPKKRGRPKKII